jgi:hypothetical protein
VSHIAVNIEHKLLFIEMPEVNSISLDTSISRFDCVLRDMFKSFRRSVPVGYSVFSFVCCMLLGMLWHPRYLRELHNTLRCVRPGTQWRQSEEFIQ